MRSVARTLPLVVLGLLLFIAAVACDDGDDSSDDASTTSTTSTTTVPTPEGLTPLAEIEVTLTPVADVTEGVGIATRSGDDRLYVAQQPGRVVAVDVVGGGTETVLDISDDVTQSYEQGLVGLAFSPDGAHLYVHYSDLDGDSRIDEYAVDDSGIDEDSQREVLTVDQPDRPNHKGGKLAFGPDGMLWIALGDGGGRGDPDDNGQNTNTLLGTLLRIDPSSGDPYAIPEDNPFVDGGGAPEVWSYGLRNPWQFSFDTGTGDLWIGDVGQSAREEINFGAAPERGRGANYGWNLREGTIEFRGDPPAGAVDPVFEYEYGTLGCSVTGGVVYRGEAMPDLDGVYVYTDLCIEELRVLRLVDAGVEQAVLTDAPPEVVAFGEGADGELYFVSYTQGLFRIDPA